MCGIDFTESNFNEVLTPNCSHGLLVLDLTRVINCVTTLSELKLLLVLLILITTHMMIMVSTEKLPPCAIYICTL